ncbi:SulP family inorganic anion transporter [Methylolobus aquaticus]
MPQGQTREDRSMSIARLIPAIHLLHDYSFKDARADLIAGLTVATVAVPQAMAYALVAGLPGEYGLYTAIVMTVVGAVFASSRQLINGPTNAISIAVLSVVASVPPDLKIQACILLTFMVGAIQLAITMLRLGDLTGYISHSVIIGFTLGAGSLIVLDQLKNLLGLKAVGDVHDHFLYRFWRTLTEGGDIHQETLLLGIATIALVVVLRWIKGRLSWGLLPDLFIVVVTMSCLATYLGMESRGVKVIGEIPAKLPSFEVPVFDAAMMRDFATGALAISVLGLLEALSMAKALASATREKLDMNQQCLSEGLANLVGSFFQCIPGSGSLTRSAINQQAGAVTQWSGVVSAVAVAVIMLVLAPYARFIPKAVLAGILLVSAWKMVDWHALSLHFRATRFDAVIVGVTAFSAVGISIEFCVLIGIFMSFLLAVPRAGRMRLTEFVVTGEGAIHECLPEDVPCTKILLFGLEGELFFGSSAALERHFAYIESRVGRDTEVLLLRMKRARNPDAVALGLIEEFLDRIRERGIKVILCGVSRHLYDVMKRTGFADRLGEKEFFLEQPVRLTSTILAVRHAYELISEPCPTCPRRDTPIGETPLYFVP